MWVAREFHAIFNKCPDILEDFQNSLYWNVWGTYCESHKMGKYPELLGGQQKHWVWVGILTVYFIVSEIP